MTNTPVERSQKTQRTDRNDTSGRNESNDRNNRNTQNNQNTQRKKVKAKKRIHPSTVILLIIIGILLLVLAFACVAIVKLNRSNLFSKSILISSNYPFINEQTPGETQENKDSVKAAKGATYEIYNKIISGKFSMIGDNLPEAGNFEVMIIQSDPYLLAKIDPISFIFSDDEHDLFYEYYSTVESYREDDPGSNDPEIFFEFYGDHNILSIQDWYLYQILSNCYNFYLSNGVSEKSDKELKQLLKYEYTIDLKGDTVILDIPHLTQNETLPNGCEAVSATILLRNAGSNISPEEFVDSYLEKESVTIKWGCRYGPNPKEAYAGDPRSKDGGYGCFAPVIVNALKKSTVPDGYRVKDLSGKTLSELAEKYIANGTPVAVWVTVGMTDIEKIIQWQSTDGSETFLYPANEHCMVLVGFDEENYYFNDPLQENKPVSFPKEKCLLAYNSLGMQAVALVKRK